MNQQLHRIVFNKARGIYMAVAESALSHGRATGASQGGNAAAIATVRPLTLSLWVALGMVSFASVAQGQVIADRSAPRNQQPTVLPTPTGAVQVNIQTPSAAGVSRNTYSQFDVGPQGVVLNNSRTGAPSALAGAVGANPWMAKGTARVILNEVNSSNPSQLRGYIEVAGDRAQVVIANPAGITCDGCGFVNASRATLTTGAAVMNSGNLESFRVERGTVAVEGRGLDARGADYTDIIARTVQVNAGVWANRLKVTQGANLVNVDNSQATAVEGRGAAPTVGLDVSNLGGMYAGHITLVGTEAGVGVRNAGVISAQAGDVFVTADGKLINLGQINSAGRFQADAAGGIENSGSLYAKGDAVLQTRGHIRNTNGGFIGSAGDLHLRASGAQSQIQSDADTTLAAGLTAAEDGETSHVGTTGTLFMQANDSVLIHGQSVAGGDIHVTSKAIDASYSQLSGQNLMFVALEGGFDAQGATMLATSNLQAKIGLTWRTDNATVSAATFDITAHDLSNQHGQIVQTGAGPLNLTLPGSVDNTNGVIVAQQGAVSINSATLGNQGGHIGAEGALLAHATGGIDNQSGTLAAQGDLTLHAASLDNREGYIGGRGVQVDTRDQALDNRAGLIQADGQLHVDTHGHALLNSASGDKGGLLSTGAMTLDTGAVDNAAGRIWAGGGATLNGQSIDNTGGGSITGVGNAVVVGAGLDNRGGEIQFTGGVDIGVGPGTVDNTGSLIRAGDALVVNAGSVNNNDTRNNDQGLQGHDVSLNAETILNQRGAIVSDNELTLGSSGHIDNSGGLLSAVGTLTLRDTGSPDLQHNTLNVTNMGGTLVAGRHIGIDASQFSFDGKVFSAGTLDLRVNTNLAELGDFHAAGLATLTTTGNYSLDDKLVGGEGLYIHAQRIELGANADINTAGSTHLQSDTSLTNRGRIDGVHTTVEAETTLDNIGGRIYGDHVSVQAETVNNTSARVLRGVQTGNVRIYHAPWNRSYYESRSGFIGARERLDVGAAHVNVGSGSEILSEGTIHFGRTLDAQGETQGLGQTLRVTGGAVRAAGAITYGVEQVTVERERPVVISTRAPANFTPTSVSRVLYDTGGAGNYRAVETRTTTQTESYFDEAASGRAGVLESGGTMHFGDARLHNDQSRVVAAGAIDLRLDNYTTGQYTGELATKVSIRTDTAYRDDCKKRKGDFCSFKNNRTDVSTTEVTSSLDDRDNPSVRLDLSTAELRGTNINLRGKDDAVGPVDVAGGASGGTVAAPATTAAGGVTTQAPGGASNVADPSILHSAAPINLALPTSALYNQHHEAGAPVLVTTDAQFSGYRTWLDSSYLLTQLGVAPGSLGPRLGDGYYEQRLVREQTSRLIGTRLLNAEQNNETEYFLLMKEGVAFARVNNLQVGQALTPDQIAKLTTDIVWMVRRDVTRADGSTVQALVPQVYARTTDAEVGATGSIIAGNRVNVTASGDFTNTGTLVGRDSLRVSADNIHNPGLMRGGSVALQAQTDITNLGGQIRADRALSLDAGRDITVASTTRTNGFDVALGGLQLHERHTDIDRLASLSVRGDQGQLSLNAGQDITLTAAALNQGGSGGQTWINAGRDLHLDTVDVSHSSGFFASEDINHLHTTNAQAGTVIVGQGNVTLRAADNVTARAASVSSEGGLLAVQAVRGDISLQAGTLSDTVRDARVSVDNGTFKTRTTLTRDDIQGTQAIGSVFSGKDLLLKAGQDITVQASELNAEGNMEIDAGRDLSLSTFTATGESSHLRHSFQRANDLGEMAGTSLNSFGLFDAGYAVMKKKAEDQVRTETWTQAQGSSITAGALSTRSGRDTSLSAATVVVENNLSMHAGRDLSLLAAEQTQADVSRTSSYANGQLGSWWQPAMGSAKQSEHQHGSSTTHVGTQVASLKGSVALSADGSYTQTGSVLAAPEGDISISAREVQIDSAIDRGESTQGSKTSRTAIGGSISIPIVDALLAARSAIKSGEETRSDRMKGMAAINAGLAAQDAYSAASDMATKGMTTGIKVSVNVSHNESHSDFTQSGTNAVGSSVAAGGDLNIQATGAGADSTLNVIGSSLSAGNNTHLKADGAIQLAAAENTAVQKSTDGSSGASVGVSFALLGDQNGFTIDLAASRTRGRADGTDSTWNNTHVTTGKTFTLESGGDTTLRGAVVNADRVEGAIGGNLHIESLQDKSTYDSKQESAGLNVSLCIPPICYGAFVSAAGFNFGTTRINANQRYVAEQSGFFAGEGGYDIKVNGSTELVGGVVAASQQALDQGKTSFSSTGGVTQRDLVNVADFNAEAFAVSAQVTSATSRKDPAAAAPAPAPAPAPSGSNAGTSASNSDGKKPTASAGFGSDSEHLESITQSGIGVSTASDTAGILRPIFNAERTRREMGAQVQITQTFSQRAPRAVAELSDYLVRGAKNQTDEARIYLSLWREREDGRLTDPEHIRVLEQLERTREMTPERALVTLEDPEPRTRQDMFAEGGAGRVVLHTLVGAIGGGGWQGAIGAGGVSAAAPQLNALQDRVETSVLQATRELGLDDGYSFMFGQATGQLASTGMGAALGGATAGGFALAVDTNNRQLHRPERTLAERLARESGGRFTAKQIEDAMRGSGNTDYRETVLDGLFTKDKPYDSGAVFHAASDGSGRAVQIVPPHNAEVAAFVIAHTGGTASPYQDLLPSSPGTTAGNGTQNAPRYGRFTANGETFDLLLSDCPAVSCTNGTPIARFGLNERDRQALDAYDTAANRRDGKAVVTAGLGAATAYAFPITFLGTAGGGFTFGGANNFIGQLIDNDAQLDQVSYDRVGSDAGIGGLFGFVGYGAIRTSGLWARSVSSLDDYLIGSSTGSRSSAALESYQPALDFAPRRGATYDGVSTTDANGNLVPLGSVVPPSGGRLGPVSASSAVVDGASGVVHAPKSIDYLPPGSVVRQPAGSPLCGPTSCNMVINDAKGHVVDLNEVVSQFDNVRASGVNIHEMNQVLGRNGITATPTTTLSTMELNAALAKGQPVIVGVPAGAGNHFLIVDSVKTVDNVSYYMTRDPFIGPRGVREDLLVAAINRNGNAIIIGN